MVQINFGSREISCKLVYYGPGLSGKTTNLQVIHAKTPDQTRGNMTSIATEGDRTLFFDFLPLEVGTVRGMKTKFQLYTVPGQVYYNATRKLVLGGADGVVFVADSQESRLQDNIESMNNMEENLQANGLDIETIPIVLQLNKRDLPDAMDAAELAKALNRRDWPVLNSVAVKGEGVFATLKTLLKLVLANLDRNTQARHAHARQAPDAGAGEADGAQNVVEEAEPPPAEAAPAAAQAPPATGAGETPTERKTFGRLDIVDPVIAAEAPHAPPAASTAPTTAPRAATPSVPPAPAMRARVAPTTRRTDTERTPTGSRKASHAKTTSVSAFWPIILIGVGFVGLLAVVLYLLLSRPGP